MGGGGACSTRGVRCFNANKAQLLTVSLSDIVRDVSVKCIAGSLRMILTGLEPINIGLTYSAS